jgi:hypothetical protein
MKPKLDYKPNRTTEELDNERLIANLKLTDTERFLKMTALIKLHLMLKKAKITHK